MSIILLNYQFSDALTAPPTGNQIRLDAAYPYTSAARAWVRNLSSDGADLRALWLEVPVGTDVYIQDKNDSASFVRLRMIGPATAPAADYVELPVAYREHGALVPNQAALCLIIPTEATEPSAPPGGGVGAGYPPATGTRGSYSVLVTPAVPIVSSTGSGAATRLETELPHGLVTGDTATIAGHDAVPSLNGPHVVTVVDLTHVTIAVTLTTPGSSGTLTRSQAIEPLTLVEAKLRAGLDWAPGDPRDALMSDFIAAARQQVEQDIGLALLTQTRDLFLDALTAPLPAQSTPLQATVSITAIAADGTETVIPAEAITYVPGLGWAVASAVPPLRAVYPWVVRILAGWAAPAALPPLLRQAHGLLTAHYATTARDLATSGTIIPTPLGYEEAIAPFRLVVLGMIAPSTGIAKRPHRITLQNPGLAEPDGDGGWTDTWTDLDPPAVFAEVAPATAKNLEQAVAGTLLAGATHVVTMPYHPGVTTQTRIIHDGRTLSVTGVATPDERKVETIAACVELVA